MCHIAKLVFVSRIYTGTRFKLVSSIVISYKDARGIGGYPG